MRPNRGLSNPGRTRGLSRLPAGCACARRPVRRRRRESDHCSALLESALFAPFLAAVAESPLAVWVDTAAWAHLRMPRRSSNAQRSRGHAPPLRLTGVRAPRAGAAPFFWRNALRRVCEGKLGVGLIKDKPLKQLLAYAAPRLYLLPFTSSLLLARLAPCQRRSSGLVGRASRGTSRAQDSALTRALVSLVGAGGSRRPPRGGATAGSRSRRRRAPFCTARS